MKREKLKNIADNVGNAISFAFLRMPFFELAFVTIIVVVLLKLPSILDSLNKLIRNKETFWLGVGICIALFITIGICLWGLFSRTKFYKRFYIEGEKRVIVEEIQPNEEIDTEAEIQIKKAFDGEINEEATRS